RSVQVMDSVSKPLETYLTPFGYQIYQYDRVSSTNNLAKEIARKSIKDHVVVIAETQTHGRGRLERTWISPHGGLWFSIILRPKISLKEALRLTFIMSSTVAETIKTTFGLETKVMWPNDILVEDRKICGILTEAITSKDSVEFVVIGVGLNANLDLDSFPENLRETVTTLKHELGYEADLKALVLSLLQTFEEKYKQLLQGRWTSLLKEWKNLASFLGGRVAVTSFDEVSRGEALDVGQDGALLIELDGGGVKRVIVGDVTVEVQL
ncbi:biotin--[acetyl-CoA-carboxylase] ligase, partial [Candidatus Bathyarchaeota archaeon]|nr:biotin--[acetyl-CoA-carboxylase] ligase [Candidatus Bathyarchaeota archaeon]